MKEFKARKTGPHQKKWCRKQIEELIELNILRPSESNMLSPLVFVVKNKEVLDPTKQDFRMCVDFKYVNEITERRSCCIPIIKDSIQLLVGNNFFAKMDFKLGYHQCGVHENLNTFLLSVRLLEILN